jgi:Family of unknown function (DUF5683)
MYKCLFVILFVAGFVFAAKAQKPDTVIRKSKSDSITTKHDSATSKKYVPKITKEKTYHPDSLHDPHKALMRSLMIPGWGQIYNHHWWKVPFIYGGLGFLVDRIVVNGNYYQLFLKEDILRQHGVLQNRNSDFAFISDADVDAATNAYRRDRDLSILGTLGFWGVQMIEAYVDAKFQQLYTMDNNLSFKIRPGMISQPTYAYSAFGTYIPAVTITFTLR